MKWLIASSLVLGLVLAGGLTWYMVVVAQIRVLPEPIVVEIPEYSGTEGAAQALSAAGVINSPLPFIIYSTMTGQRADIRSGRYTFSGEINLPLVLQIITQQQSLQNEVEVTLLEGWSAEEMGAALAAVLPFTVDDYVTVVTAKQAEGYLFPDTYRFYVDASPEDVVDKQLAIFEQKFTSEMITALQAQGRTVSDAVILASIVEKEARTLTDKQLVAGVFWKRLDNGKRLESDVTVNYLTGKTTVSYSDADIESAYNTYRHSGLPPTPISNPGYDALYAVVYPTPSDNWYFIATPDGEMLYTTTYDEHLTLKNQYYP